MPAAGALAIGLPDEPNRRAVAAVLRRRLRWLRTQLPPRLSAAARFLPVLLHGSFQHPLLRGDAPGIEGMRFRPGWAPLAHQFGLPPPFRIQRGRRMIEALVGLRSGAGLEVFVFCSEGLTSADADKVRQRVLSAQGLLDAAGAAVNLQVLAKSEKLALDILQRAIAFGALLAGTPPLSLCAARLEPEDEEVEPGSNLAVDAPGALAPLALALFADRIAPDPVQALLDVLEGGLTAGQLSDPAVFCVEWAGPGSGLIDQLRRAVAFVQPDRGPRRSPAQLQAELPELLALGAELSVGFLRAARRATAWRDRERRVRLLRKVLVAGFPRALVPALGERLSAAQQKPAPEPSLKRKPGLLRLPLLRKVAAAGPAAAARPSPRGANAIAARGAPAPPPLTVARLGPGRFEASRARIALAQGRTAEQARVRGLALLALFPGLPLTTRAEAPWDQVHARLVRAEGRTALLLAVEPSAAPGPPFDPLNRGIERTLGFGTSLLVRLAAGLRPSARRLNPVDAVDSLLAVAARGDPVEVVSSSTEAQPAAARLLRMVGFVREASAVEGPDIAVQAGGLVVVPRGATLRHFSPLRYLSRPRACRPDPESPDLSLTPERPPAGATRGHPGVLECRLAQVNEQLASILYVAADGSRLREVIPLAWLEAHLRDGQAMLRKGHHYSTLAVQGSGMLEQTLRGIAPLQRTVEVTVSGELPLGLIVEVAGERFGRGQQLGWAAAALTVAASWPPDERGRISIQDLQVTALGQPVGPLLALYARSLVIRRLEQHISLQLFPLGHRQSIDGHEREGRVLSKADGVTKRVL